MPTEYPLRDLERYARVCRRIDEGRLPVHLPDRVIASHGSGSNCDACDQPINAGDIEYDVENPRNGSTRLRLHLECYLLWQIECVKRIREQREDDLCSQPAPLNGSSEKTPSETGRARLTRH